MDKISSAVKDRAGLRTEREAKRALGAAVGALHGALAEDDARALAAALPGAIGRILERPSAVTVEGVESFYAEADRRERVGPGFAREHAQVVLQVLAEELDPELVARLRRRVRPSIAALLTGRGVPSEAPPHVHLHPPRVNGPPETLSRSRSRATESIAETRHPVAHEHSVARSAEPHAEDMVETARLPLSSRADETLASAQGRPGRK